MNLYILSKIRTLSKINLNNYGFIIFNAVDYFSIGRYVLAGLLFFPRDNDQIKSSDIIYHIKKIR